MGETKAVFVIDGVRTPTGRLGGDLAKVHPAYLGKVVIEELIKRVKVKAEAIDESIFGNATQTGQQGYNMANVLGEWAFGPVMPASTVNMLCGSSAQTIRFATGLVASGENNLVLVGGDENNLLVSQGADLLPTMPHFKKPLQKLETIFKNSWRLINEGADVVKYSLPDGYILHPMGISGDAIAKAHNISRKEADEFAMRSQNLAEAAWDEGKFNEEVVIVKTTSGVVDKDEGIRPTTLSGLSKLKPSFNKDGIHTAGNSSQISVGAAALLIANEAGINKHNLKPKARIVASAVVKTNSQRAEEQLIGPVYAIEKALKKAGLNVSQIELFEINEAFASVVLATINHHKINMDIVNVNGGAIALGHPLGTSGARLPVTLISEMQKRKIRYGLSTLCIGGGQAIAHIFERV